MKSGPVFPEQPGTATIGGILPLMRGLEARNEPKLGAHRRFFNVPPKKIVLKMNSIYSWGHEASLV